MATPSILISLLLTAAPQVNRMQWDVEGLQREALVALPDRDDSASAPVVFVFHGHGGNARQVGRSFRIHDLWPEAIVVYPQGVPTPGRLTDPEGKRNGWQHAVGEQDDRDLKFFDAMLATLKQDHNIDESRVYSTGHSNGGGFTYLLWAERPDVLAAVAPSSAGTGNKYRKLTPKPCLHVAGTTDALVRFEWQDRTMTFVRRLNGCETEGTPWAKDATLYKSTTGTPFVSLIHPGGHKFLAEAPSLIVRFFKEHSRREPEAAEREQHPDQHPVPVP
jgi:polyhydroxybutyrate depolymerase